MNSRTLESSFPMVGTPSSISLWEYRPYDNTTTDVEEYALGMLAGGFISPKYAGSGQVPNYFKLKEMKLI